MIVKITNHFWECLLLVLIAFLFLAFALQRALAAGESFSWHVDCVMVDEDGGQRHVWVGYTASQDWTGGQLEYIGNGPGIGFSDFQPGEHDRVLDVITDYGDVWIREDDSMSELTITSETTGPDCADGTGLMSGHLDLDPETGVINNAADPNGNSCYSSGQVCTTEQEWIDGYYRMHGTRD